MPTERGKWRCKITVSETGTGTTGGGEEVGKVKGSPFSVSTVVEKYKENSAEEVRNFEAVIETEETMSVEKTKDVLMSVGFKRPPTIQDIIPNGNSLIESGRSVNICIIDIPVR